MSSSRPLGFVRLTFCLNFSRVDCHSLSCWCVRVLASRRSTLLHALSVEIRCDWHRNSFSSAWKYQFKTVCMQGRSRHWCNSFRLRIRFRLYFYRVLTKLGYRFRARAIRFTLWCFCGCREMNAAVATSFLTNGRIL